MKGMTMEQKKVLMIGGPADGQWRAIDAKMNTIWIRELLPELIPITLAAPAQTKEHAYRVSDLAEGEAIFHVAVWEGHCRPVIETLLGGYNPR
jgi:hypothetical protein